MSFLAHVREKKMKPKLIKEVNFYKNNNIENVLEYQLNKFNELWKDIQVNVPYYRVLLDQKKLPKRLKSIRDLQLFPILEREFATKNIKELINYRKKADTWGSTGGSTGNPLQFPKWKSESTYCEPSVWYVRNFYGIKRSDKMFRLWGHSHTLGKGLTRIKNKVKFGIGLPLIGYKRFSAYDLSTEKLREAGEEILKFKPKYIIGYSKALHMLAVANSDRRSQFHNLKLKAVIGAAEGFEKDTDKELVSDIFGCQVALQYAAMETNYIAHSHPDGGYKVLWKNNLIECVDERGDPSETGRILITSLYPRAFPLIRYELGDIIANCNKSGQSVYSFEKIKGRDNDFLMLDEDTPIHSEGITHAVKFSKKVIAYQIRYTNDMDYTIYIKANEPITKKDIEEIKKRLRQVDGRLESMNIKQTEHLKQTVAGKTKWLIEE